MKKILVALSLLAVTGTAMAQHHGHGFRHHGLGHCLRIPRFGAGFGLIARDFRAPLPNPT